jgi:hypothetical protein
MEAVAAIPGPACLAQDRVFASQRSGIAPGNHIALILINRSHHDGL